jgi:ABC-type Fe3+ transport system substrate-binding protein
MFEENFLKFAKNGIYEDVLRHRPRNGFYEKNIIQDPNHIYSVLGASLSVIIVDHTLIGDLPIPKSFKELLDPIYKGKIAIHGHGDSFCDMGIILSIYNLYGIKGVSDFSHNIQRLLHFSQVAKNIGKSSSESVAISIMTESTTRLIQNIDNCSFIWPAEGPPVFPLLMTVKKSKADQVSELIDFLSGEQMGKFLAKSFFVSPHVSVGNKDYSNEKCSFLGWEQVESFNFKKMKDGLQECDYVASFA